MEIKTFINKVKEAGYDGVDTWIPEDPVIKRDLFDALQQHELVLVAHQHQAHGVDFAAFKASFLEYLHFSAQGGPVLINSHTGRDYFSFAQNLELVDIASGFSAATGIPVVHETHRGRMGYSPGHLQDYFDARAGLLITADLSHWVCVTESLLENFGSTLEQAIIRTRHIHARVGFEEGPQVPDPRAPEWKYAVDRFLSWWDRIIEQRVRAGDALFTITTEFGPPPYLPTLPFSNQPVADQFAINSYMKDLLSANYPDYVQAG